MKQVRNLMWDLGLKIDSITYGEIGDRFTISGIAKRIDATIQGVHYYD